MAGKDPGNYSPSLWVDHDCSWFVVLSTKDHSYSCAVSTGNVNDVGDLTGPVDETAVDVNAQVERLQAQVVPTPQIGHHSHTLRAENGQSVTQIYWTEIYLIDLCVLLLPLFANYQLSRPYN